MSAGARSTLAVVAALVLSTLWSAASAIAVLLGIAHIIDPLAPPPVRLGTRSRPREDHPQRPASGPPPASPSASRMPLRADTDVELLISPTLTDEPASFLSPDDDREAAVPSISISRPPSPPSESRMKRMFSFDPSAQRGRSTSPSPLEGNERDLPVEAVKPNCKRPAAKDRHAVSAEIARAAWVRPSRRAKGRRAS